MKNSQGDDTLGGRYFFNRDIFEWLQMPLKTRKTARYPVMLWHWWFVDNKIRWVSTDGMRANVWEYEISANEPDRLGNEGSAVPMISRVYGKGMEYIAFEVVDAQADIYVDFRKKIQELIFRRDEEYEEYELCGLDNARDVGGAYRRLIPFVFYVDRNERKIEYVGESVSARLLSDKNEFVAIDGYFITQAMKGMRFGTKIMRYRGFKETVFINTSSNRDRWAAIQPIRLDGYISKWKATS